MQTFGTLAQCVCGSKMYVRSGSAKYVCRKCHNKIPMVDLEGVVHDELKAFFASPAKLASHAAEAKRNLAEKEQALAAHEREIAKVREEMTRTHRLYLDGHVTPQGFGDFYKPAEERLNQLQASLPKLQADVDGLRVTEVSSEEVLAEATALYDRWPLMTTDEKRRIAEALIEKVVIGDGEIDITFSYLPTSEEQCKSQQQWRGLGREVPRADTPALLPLPSSEEEGVRRGSNYFPIGQEIPRHAKWLSSNEMGYQLPWNLSRPLDLSTSRLLDFRVKTSNPTGNTYSSVKSVTTS